MDFVNGLDSIEMIKTGVKTDLIHDGDSSFLGCGVQFHHCWGDVGCGYDVLLSLDAGLDDGSVVGVWNERNGDIVFSDLCLESSCVVDVE